MPDTKAVSFGDNVRIRSTALTEKLGFANSRGNVHGQTTPSVTGVDVIGQLQTDYAINVFFEDRKEGFWFAPDLVEFVDHAPGTEISFEGASKKWIRSANGEWQEVQRPMRSPWWKFW